MNNLRSYRKKRILISIWCFFAMNRPWTSTFQDYTPADINIGFNPIPIGTYYRAELHNGTLQSLGPPKSGLKLLGFQEVCFVKELNDPTGRLQVDHGFTCLSVYVITQESMNILFEFTTYQRIGGRWWLCARLITFSIPTINLWVSHAIWAAAVTFLLSESELDLQMFFKVELSQAKIISYKVLSSK